VTGRISFIGAGPGAADLITVRGARRLAEADIVLWAASLVASDCVREHASAGAELIDSSRLTHEQAVEIFRRAERDRLKVARVHSGDPSLWGAVQEQYDACTRMDLEVEIVPGVPAFSAAAASIGRELTVPEVAQSVVLTRLEGGKTPMPDGERVREFARHGTTMVVYLSAARTGRLVEELDAGGYPTDTPVLIAYKVTWPDELILRTTLGELEKTVKDHKLWRHTLFLIGPGLNAGGTRSRLYHAGHFHTYRRADPAARRARRAEREAASVAHPVRRDAEIAWWAVRNWQESARGGRAQSAREVTSTRKTSSDDQPGLFASADESVPAADETAPADQPVEPQPEAVVDAVPASSGEPEAPPQQPEPGAQPEPEVPAPASRTSAARQTGASSATARTTPKTRKAKPAAKGGRSGSRSTTKRKTSGESGQG
jgi:precorrin-4 C11-methyltransferase